MDKIELFKKIGKIELSNLKKETVLKIVNLNDYVNGEFIVDNIIKKIEKIDEKNVKTICDVRLLSIIDDFEKIKYKEKKKLDFYSIYKYSDKKIIYITKNVMQLKKIEEILKDNSNEGEYVEIWNIKNEIIDSFILEKNIKILDDLKYKKIKKIIIKK